MRGCSLQDPSQVGSAGLSSTEESVGRALGLRRGAWVSSLDEPCRAGGAVS